MKDRKIICVTSSKPSTVLTAGGGGGCLTLLCPRTTSVFSSLRVSGDMSGKVGVGLASLAFFPKSFSLSSSNYSLAMGYGYTTKNKDDSYAMLLTIRQATVPPILHWKTRLPEGHLTAGITVSPCGHYAIGGGNTGNIYIWSTFGGTLLRVVKAHYRPVHHMTWMLVGGTYFATGGADGMVHVFDLADLVDINADTSVSPIRTWSQHHMPITGLVALSDNRLASASSDGKILVLHVPSQKAIVTIQMPHKVSALTADSKNTLYVGNAHGVISMIRLDEYAMHQLSQQHGITVHRSEKEKSQNLRAVDQVFNGKASTNNESTSSSDAQAIQYQTELKGHDRPISSLTIFDNENGKPALCSGDESGCLRMWDLESNTCLHVTRPWSATMNSATDKTSLSHPIASIHVLSQSDDDATTPGMLGNTSLGIGPKSQQSSHKQQHSTSLVPLLLPLQKFRDTDATGKNLFPAWKPAISGRPLDIGATHEMLLSRYRQRQAQKRLKLSPAGDDDDDDKKDPNSDNQGNSRVAELERQLKEANEKIERWEAVNNKLMAQLNKK